MHVNETSDNKTNFRWIVTPPRLRQDDSFHSFLSGELNQSKRSKHEKKRFWNCAIYMEQSDLQVVIKTGSTHIVYQHVFSLALLSLLPPWQIWKEEMLWETLRTRRQPWRYDEPWSGPRCLVSALDAVTAGPDALTNEDGLRMMTQVEFNSLFCQKGKELRERDVSWALEVNSIYNKAQRCGFDLLLLRVVTFPVPAHINSGGPLAQ